MSTQHNMQPQPPPLCFLSITIHLQCMIHKITRSLSICSNPTPKGKTKTKTKTGIACGLGHHALILSPTRKTSWLNPSLEDTACPSPQCASLLPVSLLKPGPYPIDVGVGEGAGRGGGGGGGAPRLQYTSFLGTQISFNGETFLSYRGRR